MTADLARKIYVKAAERKIGHHLYSIYDAIHQAADAGAEFIVVPVVVPQECSPEQKYWVMQSLKALGYDVIRRDEGILVQWVKP